LAYAEAPLTNDDVIKLCKLDMGNDVVIAKINQVEAVDFKLDTNSLVNLKKANVSKEVIGAMLKRANSNQASANKSAATATESSANSLSGTAPIVQSSVGAGVVRMISKDGEHDLKSLPGKLLHRGFASFVVRFLEYPNSKAVVRTKDKRPSFLLRSDQQPAGRYSLCIAKSDESANARSIRVRGDGMFHILPSFGRNYDNYGDPEKNLLVAFDIKEEGSGIYRLSLQNDLESGEYGVLPAKSDGELFDFGVDD
jgi:hypothetical protein